MIILFVYEGDRVHHAPRVMVPEDTLVERYARIVPVMEVMDQCCN